MDNFKPCKFLIVTLCIIAFVGIHVNSNAWEGQPKEKIKCLRLPLNSSEEDFEDRFSIASNPNVRLQSRRDFIRETSAAAIFFSLFPTSIMLSNAEAVAPPQSSKPNIVPLISKWLTQNVAPDTGV
ncbi:MAG: hypothetical protein KKD11_07930, partial [Candidatus Omnitrophica bacterium]|nr:hypothetical protein [Candidatus Omnitrophota bacterium]